MRKLDRSVCPAPPCLGGYHHGTHSWGDVAPDDKAEIRTHLETMQDRRCAYCEGDIDSRGQHIEHFRRKSRHPALTFDWDNLFWSCNQTDSCGHFKDQGAGSYIVEDLVNPCCDDPDAFFIFQADGTISIRDGISAPDRHRASETLRVFSLDADWGRLRAMRKIAVSGYVTDADTAFNEGWPPDDIREFFAEELDYSRYLPFSTAIRHVLTERQ
ncbi:TIGR02646 family protein [Sphingobium yanoikuyae]|uniref:TIGR02646 family protein n=1 Tax=Sphingobium yanoikuyae TaxID=13690 RepID=A0A6P1GMM9_SPHYA|nr:retron system putative HNH endonuclease [Sphingobium yanoikuyae]QHD69698.1 TIGR02646 family protein [Sphingobium yanoikuyae]